MLLGNFEAFNYLGIHESINVAKSPNSCDVLHIVLDPKLYFKLTECNSI